MDREQFLDLMLVLDRITAAGAEDVCIKEDWEQGHILIRVVMPPQAAVAKATGA